ncbi:GGDEF-domain containing protein [Paenibacillus sp. CAA11]|nr:GGDEF-domain containing protein [Paenibacillus sp. CAA11]
MCCSLLPSILDAAEDLIYIMAVEHDQFKYAYLNQAAQKASGITSQDYGRTFYEVYTAKEQLSMAYYLQNKYQKVRSARRSFRFEDGFLLPNGLLSGESIMSPIFDKNREVSYILCITRDSTARKEYEDKLRYYAYHDELTNLLNRRFLYEFATTPWAIWLIDLDNFKNINDTLGHDVGDILLITVAERLKQSLETSFIPIRLGGDEFLIAVDHVVAEPDKISGTILDAFTPPFPLSGRFMHITTTVGVSIGQGDLEISTLLRQADIALYHAKSLGKNQFHTYNEQHSYEQVIKYDYEIALSNCLANQELELLYQPIYDTKRKQIVSVEALLRWNKDHLKVIPPDLFIPVAEESGWIHPIGDWVIRQACRDYPAIADKYGTGVKIAVNISRVQLNDPSFSDRLLGILSEQNTPPSRLDLEITESVVMHNIEKVCQILHHLRKQGFTVSLDDFGTGYSSLSMLTQLPIDKVKMDRSFITQMNPPVIASLLNMAAALHLGVIAEGVEDEEQLNFLTKMNCPEIQGYLICKPVPLTELP